MDKQLVNVYVLTQENSWELVFKNVLENIALEIWSAGFKTGENRFSIESKKDREFFEKQVEKLHR